MLVVAARLGVYRAGLLCWGFPVTSSRCGARGAGYLGAAAWASRQLAGCIVVGWPHFSCKNTPFQLCSLTACSRAPMARH